MVPSLLVAVDYAYREMIPIVVCAYGKDSEGSSLITLGSWCSILYGWLVGVEILEGPED